MRQPHHLTELHSPGALYELNRTLREVVRGINVPRVPVFTLATRQTPEQAGQGAIIFVSDAAAGSRLQGSDGVSWISLG